MFIVSIPCIVRCAARSDRSGRYRDGLREPPLDFHSFSPTSAGQGLTERRSVPRSLTPEQAQRWRDLRLEIRDMVAERAEKARRAYSRVNPTKRNLRFSLALFCARAQIGSTSKTTTSSVPPAIQVTSKGWIIAGGGDFTAGYGFVGASVQSRFFWPPSSFRVPIRRRRRWWRAKWWR